MVVGYLSGKKMLTEFYDLNCPDRRIASADMIEHDPQLRLVLVPYPVLGIPSIEAGRVEFAVAKLARRSSFMRSSGKSSPSAAPPTASARWQSRMGSAWTTSL